MPNRGSVKSGFVFLILILTSQTLLAFEHTEWNDLLRKHVHNGRVDYDGFLKSRDQLDYYLKRVKNIPIELFADYSRETRMAIWINVYNASVIRLILRFYPVDSVENIANFWDDKVVHIAGMTYSLTEVRQNVFRYGFRDERATLALISGMKSSGPLREEGYVGDRLIEQLRDQTGAFLNDERFNRIKNKSKKLKLSPLFQELSDDFIFGYRLNGTDPKFSPHELAVLSFIRVHVTDNDVRNWLDRRKYKIEFLLLDTTLNHIESDS